jgi:hypothetical protein
MPSLAKSSITQNWKYLVLNLVTFSAYYLGFRYLISSSDYGFVLITVPMYLVYLLIGSASVLFTLSVYSLFMGLPRSNRKSAPSGFFSAFSVFLGGLSAGCACQAPILYGFLYFLGLNSLEASGLVSIFADHETGILESIIALNALLILFFAFRIGKQNNSKKVSEAVLKDQKI